MDMMQGFRASCQPKFDVSDDLLDGISLGRFPENNQLKVFSVFLDLKEIQNLILILLVLCQVYTWGAEYDEKRENQSWISHKANQTVYACRNSWRIFEWNKHM